MQPGADSPRVTVLLMKLKIINWTKAMKKSILRIAGVLTFAVLFGSCSKESSVDSREEGTKGEPFVMTIFANNPDTKTVVEESGSNYIVKWQDGDKIGVYEVANGEVQGKTSSSALDFDSGDPAVSTSASATFTLSFGGTPSAPYDYSIRTRSSAAFVGARCAGRRKSASSARSAARNFGQASQLPLSFV